MQGASSDWRWVLQFQRGVLTQAYQAFLISFESPLPRCIRLLVLAAPDYVCVEFDPLMFVFGVTHYWHLKKIVITNPPVWCQLLS